MGEKLVGGPAVYGWGAELFFLPSLMGKFFFFAGATAPPSHYVAPPLDMAREGLIWLVLVAGRHGGEEKIGGVWHWMVEMRSKP